MVAFLALRFNMRIEASSRKGNKTSLHNTTYCTRFRPGFTITLLFIKVTEIIKSLVKAEILYPQCMLYEEIRD